MDPNATLEELRNHALNGDFDLAYECKNQIRDWIKNGGFAPTITPDFLNTLLLMYIRNLEGNR